MKKKTEIEKKVEKLNQLYQFYKKISTVKESEQVYKKNNKKSTDNE